MISLFKETQLNTVVFGRLIQTIKEKDDGLHATSLENQT